MDVLNMSSIARSVTVRLIVVGVLAVVLFVPLMMVWALVGERAGRRDAVARKVSAVWGGQQHVGSLALVIPVERTGGPSTESPASAAVPPAERRLIVLPDTLTIEARLEPEIRRRSIFEVVLYRVHVVATGQFRVPDPSAIALAADERLQSGRGILRIGIADLRGVVSVDRLDWGGVSPEVEPAATSASLGPGLSAAVPIELTSAMPFQIELTVAGSDRVMFMPSGKSTDVTMTSPWTSPGFTGVRLPEEYTITKGFTARWQSTSLSRPFPQVWVESSTEAAAGADLIAQSTFGVNLVTPVDNYQQTERAVKYGFLFIVLTLGLVLVRELTGPGRIHPVQYLFVGLALVIFFLLLLSISEHLPFVAAYGVAAAATVALVGAYTAQILDSRREGVIVTCALGMLYGTLFVLLQLEDLALLVGAVMVFALLALAMYLTRRVDWYGTTSPSGPGT